MTNKIYLDNKLLLKYINKDVISISNPSLQNDLNININLLTDLLEKDNYYNALITCLKNKDNYYIEFYGNNKEQFILKIPKIIIVQGIYKLVSQKIIVLNHKLKTRLKEIEKIVSINNYSYINKIHVFTADSKKFSIPVADYFKFLNLNEKKFNDFFIYENLKYNGIKKKYFIYGLMKYLKFNDLLRKYLFSPLTLNRIKKIKNMEYLDYESINTYLETSDLYINKIKLDEELEKDLLNKIDFNNINIEDIIKIYIKMCKMFTYDSNFYINNQIGNKSSIHANISNLSLINKTNNKIVCYEFTSIFSYILRKLNINYKIHQKTSEYGMCHNYLTFRYKEYLIKVDAVLAIMESDLTNAKTNTEIDGLICNNSSIKTRKKFLKHLKNCYQKTYLDLTNEYQNDILTKFDLITSKINSLNLEIIDALAYFYRLSKLLFTNIILTVVRQKDKNNLKPVVIIYLDNLYFIYDYPNLKSIEKDELERKFINKDLEYFKDEVPGIKK